MAIPGMERRTAAKFGVLRQAANCYVILLSCRCHEPITTLRARIAFFKILSMDSTGYLFCVSPLPSIVEFTAPLVGGPAVYPLCRPRVNTLRLTYGHHGSATYSWDGKSLNLASPHKS